MRRTGTSALALPATALVGCLWLAVACAIGAPPSPTASSAVNSPAPPAWTPTSTAPPAPDDTPPPSSGPTTVAAATAAVATATPPGNSSVPGGQLSAGAGSGVAGWQGSYCWQKSCLDMAGPPAQGALPAVQAGVGSELRFAVDSGPGVFYDWHVDYAAANGQPKPLASGDPFDPDANQTDPPMKEYVTFTAPPAGDWTLTAAAVAGTAALVLACIGRRRTEG